MAKNSSVTGSLVPEGLDNVEVYNVALEVLVKATEDSPLNSSELVEKVANKLPAPLAGYLIYQSLLQASKAPASRIRSRKGRNGGYFLISEVKLDQDTLPSLADLTKEKTLEKHLWPAVSDWLRLNKSVDRVSSLVANLKSGGVWSNPDVVGLNIIKDLGFFDVEITTLEVKPSLNQWRYYFFEAVSHKRFSERVYFVYREETSSESIQKAELMRYAEKYGVGIIEIQIGESDYKKIRDWPKLSDADKADIIESFVEIVPAPFEAISVRDKISFLRQLGIKSEMDLYNFGATT